VLNQVDLVDLVDLPSQLGLLVLDYLESTNLGLQADLGHPELGYHYRQPKHHQLSEIVIVWLLGLPHLTI
jgi:hypothetical protein